MDDAKKDLSLNRQKKACFRIIDANLNRSTEGLRVLEDIARFYLDSRKLQSEFKVIRHKIKKLRIRITKHGEIIKERDSLADVGILSKKSDFRRDDLLGLFLANAQRLKESFRTLEEATKLLDERISEGFKKIRFKFYSIEKNSVMKIKDEMKNDDN